MRTRGSWQLNQDGDWSYRQADSQAKHSEIPRTNLELGMAPGKNSPTKVGSSQNSIFLMNLLARLFSHRISVLVHVPEFTIMITTSGNRSVPQRSVVTKLSKSQILFVASRGLSPQHNAGKAERKKGQ